MPCTVTTDTEKSYSMTANNKHFVALTPGRTELYVHNTHFCNATPQTRGKQALSQLICFQQLTNTPGTANCPTLLQNPSPVVSKTNRELLIAGRTFFDYGCGHGEDVELLRLQGVMASGWDPAFRPDVPCMPAEIINLGYVLNVIEDPQERANVLADAWAWRLECWW